MTKTELIERYGIDWYEAHNARNNARNKERSKERYANDPYFRETCKARMTLHKYCRAGEYELIENYELAKADNFKGWCIHHRLELTLAGEYAHSTEELKQMDMYYNRPYFELIFLRRGEHTKLHNNARH